jgi:hypothetical protein
MCSMAVAHVLTLAAPSWGLRVVVSEFFEDACTRHGKIPFSRNLPAALRQLPTTRPPTLAEAAPVLFSVDVLVNTSRRLCPGHARYADVHDVPPGHCLVLPADADQNVQINPDVRRAGSRWFAWRGARFGRSDGRTATEARALACAPSVPPRRSSKPAALRPSFRRALPPP